MTQNADNSMSLCEVNAMRAIVQRVAWASVNVDGEPIGRIGPGLLVYLGVGADDDDHDLQYIVDKVAGLRIFPDAEGKMNRDATQAGVSALVVSAFTLQADARKGRRPSLAAAAELDAARRWYERFCEQLGQRGLPVERGKFRAMMEVHSANDGPVCILLDSKRAF